MDTKTDDMGMGAGDETEGQGEMPSNQTVMLGPDMLGDIKPKSGDKITFCCTGDPDSEGNVTGYFEMGQSGSGGGENWEDGLRKEMSPRNMDQEEM